MKLWTCVFWTLCLTPLGARSSSLEQPRLVVVISVDQFSADLYSEYRPLFVSGLKRLGAGVIFPSGYQSHAATETCPGHSTILTGAHPARTGIIANEWIDQSIARPEKKIYCAEDPTVPGSSPKNYVVSAGLLKSSTLGDRVKAAFPGSRVVSVAGKDRAAVMLGGHNTDQLWYWSKGRFVTLVGIAGSPPSIVESINRRVADEIAHPAPVKLPEACRSRSNPVAVGENSVGFPKTPAANDNSGYTTSLAFDRDISDLAIGFIRSMRLGEPAGRGVDVLTIGLSATDYVGHTFGTEGTEMCAQLLGLDANLGTILAALDQTKQSYLLVLTADHGGHDLPERNHVHGIPDAIRVDSALLPNAVGSAISAQFNLKFPALIGNYAFGDVYLSREVPVELRSQVLAAARAHYLAHPQVAEVFTAVELRTRQLPSGPVDEWTLADRFRANFDAERSGDLLVALKPHVTGFPEAKPYVATHGSPWNYDRRVPILFYQPGRPGFEQPLPIETVDILPTIAAQIALQVPKSEIDGRCIELHLVDEVLCK